MEKTVECVPNFSEGRDISIIKAIAEAIQPGFNGIAQASGENSCPERESGIAAQEDSVRILHIDRGEAANRTVITFAGTPEDVTEAAFRSVRKAAELIDMRRQHGIHPRSGATDVLPLIPVSGVSLEECAEMARTLARKIYMELGIPCYCYEAAAFRPERKRLEVCRSGEYESLPEKIADPERRPDFSPDRYNETVERSGAVNVGARNYLIAVNFNLDSDSVAIAKEIARDVRESGRPDRPGLLKGCKAIGWYIGEYGIAQVSMNITDIDTTPLHKAYETVCAAAEHYGAHITGTEIIGLVPEKVLLDAGRHFLSKTGCGTGTGHPETATDILLRQSGSPHPDYNTYPATVRSALIDNAVRTMGLDDLKPFDPDRKVIEYCLQRMSAL